MFRKFSFVIMAMVAGLLQAAEPVAPLSDAEQWNRGVDCYRAGDLTNAVRVLRPLMASRAYGARAAEVVAKAAYDAAHAAEGATDPVKNLEEAAAAAQIALRANPGDKRVNRNFTRATDGLPALRETAHIQSVLKANAGKDPAGLLAGATEEVRALMSESGKFLDLPAAAAVARSDALAARARKLADVWFSVRELVCQAVTNEQEAAAIVERTDQVRTATRTAARQLGDMDASAYTTLSAAEQDYTQFLKMVILPPAAIRADFVAQSNAWQDVEMFNGRPWQPEALEYTAAFRQKFPAWAQAYERQAQADTNKPPFTAEAQAKVSALSTELEKVQREVVKTPDPTLQEKALDIIRQIIELLPDDGGGNGQSSSEPPKDQDKQSENKDDKKSDSKEDPGEQPQNQEENPQQEPEDDEDDGRNDAREQPEDKEVEAILKRAQERSDEHEAEKKARMRKAPLPPNERDW